MTEPPLLNTSLLESFPLPHHSEDSDKEDRGRLLVVAGSRQLPGAAVLSGVAALRAGAGKLQIATADSIAAPLGVAVPEARVIGHEETEEGCVAESAIEPMLKWAEEAQAMLIGCGLQHGSSLDKLLDSLLASGFHLPLVLDAAVLGSLAERAEALKAWEGGAILLPHAREMARLLRCDAEEVTADPLAAARTASERFRSVVVIKGPWSFIAAPDGRAHRFKGGGVGLATSGSGDVLAGIVGGLTARGAEPLTAALWGVYLHGEAGRILTRKGRIGFLAREIPDLVPGLMT
jgi:ADP-dependent NAD(P)H-hydrate dehydratase